MLLELGNRGPADVLPTAQHLQYGIFEGFTKLMKLLGEIEGGHLHGGHLKPRSWALDPGGLLARMPLDVATDRGGLLRIHRFTGQYRLKGGAQVAAVGGLPLPGRLASS